MISKRVRFRTFLGPESKRVRFVSNPVEKHGPGTQQCLLIHREGPTPHPPRFYLPFFWLGFSIRFYFLELNQLPSPLLRPSLSMQKQQVESERRASNAAISLLPIDCTQQAVAAVLNSTNPSGAAKCVALQLPEGLLSSIMYSLIKSFSLGVVT